MCSNVQKLARTGSLFVIPTVARLFSPRMPTTSLCMHYGLIEIVNLLSTVYVYVHNISRYINVMDEAFQGQRRGEDVQLYDLSLVSKLDIGSARLMNHSLRILILIFYINL